MQISIDYSCLMFLEPHSDVQMDGANDPRQAKSCQTKKIRVHPWPKLVVRAISVVVQTVTL